MEELEFTVKAIAALMRINLEELAKQTGISSNHLKEVSAGRVKLTLEDGKKLSKASGVPIAQIIDS
jgi:antitoxin component HigA of HigAB toxin-antitoxin module